MLKGLKKRIKEKFIKKEPIYIQVTTEKCLQGRIALITGGSSGIGEAMAKQFVQAGAKVIITGRNEPKLKKVAQEIGKSAQYFVLDNTDVERFESSFSKMNDFFGNIDILVNNAGIIGTSRFPDVNSEDFDNVISINLKGPFLLSQVFVKHCISKRIHGNILNVGSSSSLRPAISPYTISKWGIRAITLGLAKKCAQYGITVNGIAPRSNSNSDIRKRWKGIK